MKNVALALALLTPSAALAQSTAADRARDRDASVDHGLLASHAETVGAGNWTFNSYELFAAGLTYGFTDDFQLSAATLLPIVEDTPLTLALAPKLVLWRGDRTTVAAQLQTFMFSEDGKLGGVASAGVAVDQYLDADGRFAVHGGLQAGAVFGNGGGVGFEVAEGALLQLDLGISASLSDLFKLLAEAKLVGAYADGKFAIAEGALVNYGVRFHGKSLAADLGFIKLLTGEGSEDPFILGLPYVGFTARF